MKTYKKKDRDLFVKLMTENGLFEGTTFDTMYGPYEIRGVSPSDELLTMFGRFTGTDEQLKEANKQLGSNPYTGKWNFHLSTKGENHVKKCVDHIVYWLKNVKACAY